MTDKQVDQQGHEPASDCESDVESSDSNSLGEESSDKETSDSEITRNASQKNARDLALMAEERWLIEVLKSTRQQRNALKVEALYYQGLKAELFSKYAATFGEDAEQSDVESIPQTVDLPLPEPTYPELDIDLEECFGPNGPLSAQHEDILNRLKSMEERQTTSISNIDDFNVQEGQCNLEELHNLSVDLQKMNEWDRDDPEYDSDDEEEWSRVNIDMSMLVGDNGGD